jgi:fluoride exporter
VTGAAGVCAVSFRSHEHPVTVTVDNGDTTGMTLLWVMTGSAIGAMARLWVVQSLQKRLGHAFPWGTLAVNVSGALIIGLLAGGLIPPLSANSQPGWSLLVIGVLGSYTTVSSFSLQTLALWQARQRRQACINALASLLLCLGAVATGLALAQWGAG